MQVDLHYYATAVLAAAAGFAEPEALTVAHASQYVDDALDGRTIEVAGGEFSPLFTANDFGRYLDSTDQEVWRKVYLPFHFLPPEPIPAPGGAFLVKPGCPLGEMLLEDALADHSGGQHYRLCRLGLALHAMADTWSHQGFSGRWHLENEVVSLRLTDAPDDLAEAVEQAWRDFLFSMHVVNPARVAHFQAGFLPDYPFAAWEAEFAPLQGSRRRLALDNREEYRRACQYIHACLRQWPQANSQPTLDWSRIEPGIRRRLAQDELSREQRGQHWQGEFAWLFPQGGLPAYDKHQWEVEALGEPLRQSPFSELAEDMAPRPRYPGRPGFGQSRWAMFHRAAAAQRAWVNGQILALD